MIKGSIAKERMIFTVPVWIYTKRFILARFFIAGLLLLHCGCADKTPVGTHGSFGVQPAAILKCDAPIVSIDGQPTSAPLYEVSLAPGRHVLIVEYPTLLSLYHCTFEVDFEAGQTYEINDRSDRYPVFLNRLKKGMIFTTRLERFPPQGCTRIEGRDDS